jgi:hypothetical protein
MPMSLFRYTRRCLECCKLYAMPQGETTDDEADVAFSEVSGWCLDCFLPAIRKMNSSPACVLSPKPQAKGLPSPERSE